jgi:hypothetical protein
MCVQYRPKNLRCLGTITIAIVQKLPKVEQYVQNFGEYRYTFYSSFRSNIYGYLGFSGMKRRSLALVAPLTPILTSYPLKSELQVHTLTLKSGNFSKSEKLTFKSNNFSNSLKR